MLYACRQFKLISSSHKWIISYEKTKYLSHSKPSLFWGKYKIKRKTLRRALGAMLCKTVGNAEAINTMNRRIANSMSVCHAIADLRVKKKRYSHRMEICFTIGGQYL